MARWHGAFLLRAQRLPMFDKIEFVSNKCRTAVFRALSVRFGVYSQHRHRSNLLASFAFSAKAIREHAAGTSLLRQRNRPRRR
jgi:hypothetical protein